MATTTWGCRITSCGSSTRRPLHSCQARDLAKTDDSLIDCSNWLYVSLRRAGKEEEAAQALARITPDVKNALSHLYFYLRLLRFYQGKLTEKEVLPPPPGGPDDLEGELAFDTVTYGVANWRLYHGDRAGAMELFRKVVKGEAWNAWGFIGSERTDGGCAKIRATLRSGREAPYWRSIGECAGTLP